MIDLTLLSRKLVEFLRSDPDGSASQFTDIAVAAGLGTADDVLRFLTAVENKFVTIGFMDAASWNDLINRICCLIDCEGSTEDGLDRFECILTDCVGQATNDPDFIEIVALNTVEEFTTAIAALMANQTKLVNATSWIESNMPAGEDKTAILEAIVFGVENLIDANLSYCNRERDEAQAILDDL